MQQRIADREIRVFLSSTFRDMQFERDYLIKAIFPEIRQACRERLIEFTEIDLRWGVTKEEAEQGKVVRICLEEIDRCRPYFLGFMGDRYGWEPTDSDLHNLIELVHQFPLVEPSLKAKKSVTEMEILHGVLESPKMVDHAFFYFRAPQLTASLAKQTERPAEYYDTEAKAKAKLLDLKARVRQSGFPFRENYISLEELGEKIKTDLLAILDQRYPIDKVPSPLEVERMMHQAYANDRSQSYLASSRDTGALDAYVQSRKQDAATAPLIIGGESGLGKSALLAHWLNTYQQAHPKCFLIQHFTGVSGDATPTTVLRRIMLEIKEHNQEQDEVPAKPEDIIKDFPLWLSKVRSNDPLLLALDAINQIEGDTLNWLPDYIPPNVTLIVSTLPGNQHDQLQQRDWQTYTVQSLDNERRKTLIQNYLESYRKSLSKEQTQTIANAPQCANPLFLITVLEELRVFGVFEQLDVRIADYLQAQDPAALFAKVLQRMEDDYHDKHGVSCVPSILKAIWASRKGLTETELLGITCLNRQDLSIVLLAMDYHLSNKNGLRNFFHDYLRQAVRARYLNTQDAQQTQHRQLAEHFNKQPLNARKAKELPWQWQQSNESEKLKGCLIDIPMFAQLYDDDPHELLGYWLYLGGRYDIGASYEASFKAWEITSQNDEILAATANRLGTFLMEHCALYDSAEHMLRRAHAICENLRNPDHPDIAFSLNSLASVLQTKGDYERAEPLYRRALTIREKALGSEHPDTATSLNNLASLLKHMGDYKAAELLYRRALAITEKIVDANHFGTAKILGNLAGLMQTQGNYEAAEPLHRRALAILEKALDPDHPAVATSLNNLALLLQAKGDYDIAEPLYRRALSISEKVLGPNHPSTATSLNNLALLLHTKGDYEAAEPLYRRALAIRERSLGYIHPVVANLLNNLAALLQDKGDYEATVPLYRRALSINEKYLGEDHPNTALSLNNLAGLLQDKGDYEGAESLYLRALAIFGKSLGSDHPDTASSINSLAGLLYKKGDYEAAEPLYRRALEIRENNLGSDHPFTWNSLNNLAALLKAKGDCEAAESLYRRALALREKYLGYDHPDTIDDLLSLALCVRQQGKLDEAIALFESVTKALKHKLGDLHQDTLLIQSELAKTYLLSGDPMFAETLLSDALAKALAALGGEHDVTQMLRESLNAMTGE